MSETLSLTKPFAAEQDDPCDTEEDSESECVFASPGEFDSEGVRNPNEFESPGEELFWANLMDQYEHEYEYVEGLMHCTFEVLHPYSLVRCCSADTNLTLVSSKQAFGRGHRQYQDI